MDLITQHDLARLGRSLQPRGKARGLAQHQDVRIGSFGSDDHGTDRDADTHPELEQRGPAAQCDRGFKRLASVLDTRTGHVVGGHHGVARKLVDDAMVAADLCGGPANKAW
ncbi:MAG TPA: hypothetical protein VHW04_12350 [Solirubrobacteraceae bacterium]|nr:hypothetical protein [Solirubrobacteraceae bacterium]